MTQIAEDLKCKCKEKAAAGGSHFDHFVIQIFVYGNYNIGLGMFYVHVMVKKGGFKLKKMHGVLVTASSLRSFFSRSNAERKIIVIWLPNNFFWLARKCMNIFRALSNYDDDILKQFYIQRETPSGFILETRGRVQKTPAR